METYPTNFPLPDKESYSGVIQQGIIRTSQPVPAPNQKRIFGRHRTDLSMQFSMVNDLYKEWIAWVYEHAYGYFLMPVVSEYTPVDIMSTHRVRFTTDINYTKRGDNWLTVSVGVEILQGDTQDPLALSARVYDFVLGGTPASPSVDIVQSGAPTSPSTDTITGSLYAYTLEP